MSARPEGAWAFRGERGEPLGDALDRLRRELLRRDFLYEHPGEFRAGVEEAYRGLVRLLDSDGGVSGER